MQPFNFFPIKNTCGIFINYSSLFINEIKRNINNIFYILLTITATTSVLTCLSTIFVTAPLWVYTISIRFYSHSNFIRFLYTSMDGKNKKTFTNKVSLNRKLFHHSSFFIKTESQFFELTKFFFSFLRIPNIVCSRDGTRNGKRPAPVQVFEFLHILLGLI